MPIRTSLEDALTECGKSYSTGLSMFYPAGYLHESNLVTKYLHALKEVLPTEMVYWTEYSLGKRRRMDAVVYIESDNTFVLLEAKRIRQGKTTGVDNYLSAIKQIKSDTKRMTLQEHVSRITKNTKKVGEVKIVRVMLGQVWVNDITKTAYDDWMSKLIFPSWKAPIYVKSTERLYGKADNELKLLIAINETTHCKS